MTEGTGLLPGTPICVDFFKGRRILEQYRTSQWHFDMDRVPVLFFLSHFHQDHMNGLSPSFDFGPIYASVLTKKLLHARYGPDLQVVGLEVGETHCVALSSDAALTMNVTLIDAHHCRGAVMFLFDGYFGRILHTGDFCFDQAMLDPVLLDSSVDILYLDNTFLHPRYRFLPRGEAVKQVQRIVEHHPTCNLLIGGDSLGKEDFLVDVSTALESPVVVSSRRMEIIRMVCTAAEQAHFTTDMNAGWVYLLPKNRVVRDLMTGDSEANSDELPTIGIRPTGWACDSQESQRSLASCSGTGGCVHRVPYSSHSSFEGIVQLVQAVRPRKIICTVPGHNNWQLYLSHLLGRERGPLPPVKVPQVLKRQQSSVQRMTQVLQDSLYGAGRSASAQSDLAVARARWKSRRWGRSKSSHGAVLIPPSPPRGQPHSNAAADRVSPGDIGDGEDEELLQLLMQVQEVSASSSRAAAEHDPSATKPNQAPERVQVQVMVAGNSADAARVPQRKSRKAVPLMHSTCRVTGSSSGGVAGSGNCGSSSKRKLPVFLRRAMEEPSLSPWLAAPSRAADAAGPAPSPDGPAPNKDIPPAATVASGGNHQRQAPPTKKKKRKTLLSFLRARSEPNLALTSATQ